MFYVTFAEEASDRFTQLPTGATYAMRPEFWGRTLLPLPPFHGTAAPSCTVHSPVAAVSDSPPPSSPPRAWSILDFTIAFLNECYSDAQNRAQPPALIKCLWKGARKVAVFAWRRIVTAPGDAWWHAKCALGASD